MRKSHSLRCLVVVVALLGTFVTQALSQSNHRLTMLVVPARYSVMQVAFDMVRRFPVVVLVSYQGDAQSDSPVLHAWNGYEWVAVTMDDYRQATFLQYTPDRTILIGDEELLPPILVTHAEAWSPRVYTIPSIETATLINSFGKVFSFSQDDWRWFSARYNMELQDLNRERRRTSWYDRESYEDEYSHGWLEPRKRSPRRREQPPAESQPGEERDADPSQLRGHPITEEEARELLGAEPPPAAIVPESEVLPEQEAMPEAEAVPEAEAMPEPIPAPQADAETEPAIAPEQIAVEPAADDIEVPAGETEEAAPVK